MLKPRPGIVLDESKRAPHEGTRPSELPAASYTYKLFLGKLDEAFRLPALQRCLPADHEGAASEEGGA